MTSTRESIYNKRSAIDRRHAPDPDVIRAEYILKRKPVVISGIVDHCDAYRLWGPAYLSSIAGHRLVSISYLPDNVVRSDAKSGYVGTTEEKPLREYINEIMNQTEPRRKAYLAEHTIKINGKPSMLPRLPELENDLEEPAYFRGIRRLLVIMFWMSATEPTTSLHYDRNDNLLTQIKGRKRVVLFPPSESRFLYPFPIRSKAPHMSCVDVDNPDLVKYPQYSHAKGLETVLNPGEMLYIPAFWWHHIKSYELNMAVNFWYSQSVGTYTDLIVNRSVAYYSKFLTHRFIARPVANRIKGLGRRIKRRLFATK